MSSRRTLLVVPLLACAVPLALRAAGSPRGPQQAAPAAEQDDESVESDADGGARASRRKAPPLPPLPRTGRIAAETAARNAPFLAARPDGSLTLGCVEWTPGEGDRIEVRDGIAPDGSGTPARFVSDSPLEIVRPVAVADARGRLHVLFTQLSGGPAQLSWSREQDDGAFAPPAALTSGPLPSMNPEAALAADGRVFAAWEADVAPPAGGRSQRDVLLAPLLDEGGLGSAVRVSDGELSDVDACVVEAGGQLWVAWAAFGGRDYEIRLRSFDPRSGVLGETIDVSADPGADDLHPCLAVSPGGDPWVAWDRVEVSQRGTSAPAELRVESSPDYIDVSVQCVCVRAGKVLAPGSAADGAVPGAPDMSTAGGLPRLAFDRAGRLWIAYRYLDHPRGGRMHTTFPLLLQRLGKDGWSAPLEMEESGGLAEQAALAPLGEGMLVASYGDLHGRDEAAGEMPDEVREALSRSEVRAGCWYGAPWIGLAEAGAGEPESEPAALVERAPRRTRRGRAAPVQRKDEFVTGESHFEIRRGEDRWFVYWGDLHRHSSVSRCMGGLEPMPADRWASGRDVHLCDFMALTDHCSHTEPFSWWQLDKLVQLYASDRFCTLAGFEWSTRDWGHHNVILPGRLTPFVQPLSGGLERLYRALPADQAVTIPHHTAHGTFPVPFDACEDGHSRLIEVYQAMRGNYEFDGCFKQAVTATVLGAFARDALQQGHEFGFIASTDHGFGSAYACALAEKLDRASIFEALRARRTYGATAKGILVDFRVNDAVMGEKVEIEGDVRLRVKVRGAEELAEVAVFKDGRTLKSAGRRGVTPNTYAPMRLVVRFAAGAPAAAEEWMLEMRSEGARFGALDDRRRFARDGGAPRWTAGSEHATFVCPEGYEPPDSGAQFLVHFFATGDTTLEDTRIQVSTESEEIEVSLARLLRSPMKLRSSRAVGVSLALDAGDSAIDLESGLGTNEFEEEWVDDSPERGASWYYARVVQLDGEMAWSSPIFVTRR